MRLDTSKIMYEPNTGCHIWTGCVTAGRGTTQRKGVVLRVHRAAYIDEFGTIPNGKQINHHCDEPLCVNPAHLYAGTTQDNTADRQRRRRGANRTKHGMAKLTEAQVAEIKATPKVWGSGLMLARKFGVSTTCVCDVRAGRKW